MLLVRPKAHQKMEKNTFLAFWPVHKRKHAFSIFLPLAGIYTSGPPFGQSLSRLEHSPEAAQPLSQFCTLSQPLSGNLVSPAQLLPRPGRNCSPARCPEVRLPFITVSHKSGSTYRVISPTNRIIWAPSLVDLGWQPEVPKAIISFKFLSRTRSLGQILGGTIDVHRALIRNVCQFRESSNTRSD